MKSTGSFMLIALLILALSLAPGSSGLAQAAGALLRPGDPGRAWAAPLFATTGTAFTYQGSLQDGGSPANGAYDFQFLLFNAATAGSQVGSTVTLNDVNVVNGLFTVQLDFGGVFDGTALWLEVRVRPGSSTGSYTTLSPRQALTAAPYALYSLKAPWSGLTGVPAGFADAVDNDTTYTAGNQLSLSGTTFNVVEGSGSGLDADTLDGLDASAFASASHNHDNRYWSLTGNSGTNPSTNFLGTTDNQPLEFKVNDQRALRIEPTGTSPNLIGGYSGNSVTAGVEGATVGGGGAPDNGAGPPDMNRVTDNYGTVSGGWGNQAGNDTGTTTDTPYATVGGGYNNTASAYAATVGGGSSNTASNNYATVGGGSYNTASSNYTTVSGGIGNRAMNSYATVSGGWNNTASNDYTVVGGGQTNTASGPNATVGGGSDNSASNWYGTVGGGSGNTASGYAATVPGGHTNAAAGSYSFAAGRRARANSQGCFVWGDATNADVTCATNNRAIFRSSGGFYIYTDSSLSTGAYLAAGSGTWSNLSDRNAKEDFRLVDPQDVLEKVAQLPITTWSYKAEGGAVRHMGPTAQDFYAAFGLGDSDISIGTVDADGVALAAIQGLYQQNQEQAKRIAELESQNRRQQAQIAALEARLDALERGRRWPRLPGFLPWLGLGLLAGLVLARRRKEVEP